MTEQVNEEIEVVSEEKDPRQLKIDLITSVAEAIFPGDWDLSLCEDNLTEAWRYNSDVRPTWRLVVRIPEGTITNRRGDSHTITNYHIALPISDDFSKLVTPELKALRTSATTLEAMLGFAHPHNNRSGTRGDITEYFTWRTMCLGGGTELAFATTHMAVEGITESLLTETLLLLRTYAVWESIGGGPYYHIRNVVHEKDNDNGSCSELLEEYRVKKRIKNSLLKVLSENPELQPEIVGDINSRIDLNRATRRDPVAISNVNNSIVPALRLVLKEQWELDDAIVERRLLTSILGNKVNYNFIPLSNNSEGFSHPISRYLAKITQAEAFNGSEQADRVLTWGGQPVHFEITLDNVIANLDSEEVAPNINWETIDIDNTSILAVTNLYLDTVYEFNRNYRHQTL